MAAGSGAGRITVVAGVLVRAGSVLIARRPDGDPLGAVWEFPGGKLEPGETPAGALARELREELGIAAEIGPELERIDHDYPQLRLTLIVHRVARFAGEPRGRAGQAIAWVAPGRLGDYPFPAADARLLARLPALLAGEGA
ncbi:8-oxo-dGTP diphosphatase MutT [bacterium]|nr:8-oxo-dGTP diphosphatase MutT [bacterium]